MFRYAEWPDKTEQIAPLPLRGLMTVLIAFAAAVGNLVVALIINGTGTYTNRWAYRAVFCSQYGFACVAVAFIWFMPEYVHTYGFSSSVSFLRLI